MAYKLAEEQRAWDRNMHEATPGSDVRTQCARSIATHVEDSFQYGQDFIKPGNFEENDQPKVSLLIIYVCLTNSLVASANSA